jgi:teichuronic acid biosynthesis glycosyltransferase TuaC
MKVLLFSTLYPSQVRPVHGIFVETRMRELLKTGEVEVKVVAPVPWFPLKAARFGEYAKLAVTPRHEQRHGVEVFHPRYLLPPKVGMNVAPYTLALGALPTLRHLIADGFDFDLIDAHYYYPDGVAAMLLARWLKKPFVVTARGTDLNLIPDYPWPRSLILKTAEAAHASIGVCRALMDALAAMGADPTKLHTLSNGVDLVRFVPEDRQAARERLGLKQQGRYLIAVGHLIERKGQHIAIEALTRLPNVHLLLVGDGEERDRLRSLVNRLGLADRVHFAGACPQEDLKWWYSAADASLLCSSREGWANVLLESMACGTPVIATSIWGTPEVVSDPAAGRLMVDRSVQSVRAAYTDVMASYPDRTQTRAYAERFSWAATTAGQLALFESAINKHQVDAIQGEVQR